MKSRPRYLLIVFALAGDSTMTSDRAMDDSTLRSTKCYRVRTRLQPAGPPDVGSSTPESLDTGRNYDTVFPRRCAFCGVGGRRDACAVINRAVHILVVEDNPEDVFFLKRALDRLGIACHISIALDGNEAVDFLSSNLGGRPADPQEPALPTHVLLDLKLPLKSGLEVLEWMRAQPELSKVPVVVFTASREPCDVEHTARLRIDSYRVKPIGSAEYQTMVEEIARSWNLL